jgi:hypothetical protein
MTPNEFKAWFDGFTEAFTGCPTKAQWTRIKARVAEIDGKPVTHTVYLDRYLPSVPAHPYWRYLTTGGVGVSTCTANLNASQQYSAANSLSNVGISQNALTFNSSLAMTDLGREEAKSLAA